jgi:hypothetical protein
MKTLSVYLSLLKVKIGRWLAGTPGDWMEEKSAETSKPKQNTSNGAGYDPEADQEREESTRQSDFYTFIDLYKKGLAFISSADLMMAKINEAGKIVDYKMVKVRGISLKNKVSTTEAYRKDKLSEAAARCLEDCCDSFASDDYTWSSGTHDQYNYTEYVPQLGGPFFRQMYLTDMLAAHQKSFESYNHNPLARRLIKIIKQYALARGYKVQSKDSTATDIWDAFEKKFKVRDRMRKSWVTDYLIFGEFFLDRAKITSIDPSTIWDIITDPEDIDNVYYYYQSFPTAFQQFTGYDVKGVSGAKDVKAQEYIIRQLPYDRVFHLKGDGCSAEKRGRPTLYPILSWLKRFKDYWNAEMVKAWVQASYVYDVTVKGDDGDVSTIAGSDDIKKVPAIGSSYVHNEAVSRQLLQPTGGGGSNRVYLSDELLAIISACLGVPKETINAGISGGGSRATALVASEPFTKVIEELQNDLTDLLQELARIAFKLEGKEYKNELEFIFPSTVKDTTTETIKNITTGEVQKYISHKRAATMYAAEMDITMYDYDEEMESIKDEQEKALDLGLGPDSTAARFGSELKDDEKIDTRGQGKVDIKNKMGEL